MTGSKQTIRLLILSLSLTLFTGCQLLPSQEIGPPPVTNEELDTANETLNSSFQEALAALEQRQQANYQQQRLDTRRLRNLLEKYQQENLLLQRQHTFQIEQLGNLLEPGFTNSTTTEVIQSDGKLMLGEYEWVLLHGQQLVLPARVDSGAHTSSLHAVNLQQFERDGKTWVRFETHYQTPTDPLIKQDASLDPSLAEELVDKDQPVMKKIEIEAPLVRKVSVTQAAGSEVRPVISLLVQLGTLTQNVEFTLTNRSNLIFPVLLGRRFFMDIAVIDVSKTYIQGKPEVIIPQLIPAPVPPAPVPVPAPITMPTTLTTPTEAKQ